MSALVTATPVIAPAIEPAVSPTESSRCCPRCTSGDVGMVAGYAFTSCPDPNPTWQEFMWCNACDWAEDWCDGLVVSTADQRNANIARPTDSDFDDDIPPF